MTFKVVFEKYSGVVVLALLALSAYLQARGLMHLLGAALVKRVEAVSSLPSATSALPARAPKTADAILSRNPFDSVTGPLNSTLVSTGVPAPGLLDTNDAMSAPVCDGLRVLIVTESTDASWSLAALQAPGEVRPSMHRRGDDIAGKHVVFIGYNRSHNSPSVWLSHAGGLCQTLLFSRAPAVATRAENTVADPVDAPRMSGSSAAPSAIAAKIRKVSELEFHVDRAVVDRILDNPNDLMRWVRIVPEQKDGRTVGIRLFGIGADSVLALLGLQNGDGLETINGFEMANPQKALEAYARLRSATTLNVNLNRRGRALSIDYRIQ